jgi:hypothetical protein
MLRIFVEKDFSIWAKGHLCIHKTKWSPPIFHEVLVLRLPSEIVIKGSVPYQLKVSRQKLRFGE